MRKTLMMAIHLHQVNYVVGRSVLNFLAVVVEDIMGLSSVSGERGPLKLFITILTHLPGTGPQRR